MSGDARHTGDHDDKLAHLILKYIEGVESGESIDRNEFLTDNPEFRNDLEQFFASRDEVERVAAPIRNAAALDVGIDGASSRMRADESSLPPAIAAAIQSRSVLGHLGDFRLLREIGRGGMGIVYEAEQLSLHRRVALKVLPFAAAIDGKHVLRFKNEALAAAMLDQVHIVPVYSVGNERGVHYYAMQLVDGQSLAALIAGLRHPLNGPRDRGAGASHTPLADFGMEGLAQERVPTKVGLQVETDRRFQETLSAQYATRDTRFFETAARLMLQTADALQHAHESGIVHRDIKPANLLVDVIGQVRIIDFGLALIRSEVGLTRTGDTPGTLRYMSPEQAAGNKPIVDHRTDIYSLGATFYELLTLIPVFEGQDTQELLRKIFDAEPYGLRRRDNSIPVELETVVLKCLNKSPDERYRTASDLAADLRRYLNNEPIRAKRPTLVDRARKWARRHPSAVIGSLIVLVLVTAISTTAIILIDGAYRRERLRADEAERQFQLARRSVDELVRVSEQELAYNPAAESARRRLLTSVLSYYQEFVQQRQNDPEAQESLTDASERVESILAGLRALRAKEQIKLLSQPVVTEELGFSEKQQTQAQELSERLDQLWHDAWRDIGKVSAATLDRRFIERSRINEADLKAMLSSDQFQRLYQLDLQADVAAALREPEVIAKVKLSNEQFDQMRTIEQQEMAHWRAGPRHKPTQHHQEAGSVSAAAMSKNERILQLLTAEQQVAWRELTGIPLVGIQRN